MYEHEEALRRMGHEHVAGCDEVGRGPLAGPVVAAAVILDWDHPIDGLDDSKKLSAARRETLAEQIRTHALAWHVSFIDPDVIDQVNIYQASRQAMIDAIEHLAIRPSYILSDAMPLPGLGIPCQSIIKGDQKSASIAAASILAKVARDAYMIAIDTTYPAYGFAQHKGYPTKQHLAALKDHGPCPIHRQSYQPVKDAIHQQLTLQLEEE